MATMPKLLKVGNPDTLTPPKSKWETIVTLTPVMLTLLATVLAGLSSSEMIQAQYYRSLAAQNQSKAGDQWGFFQAKRIRGTIMEAEVDGLPLVSKVWPLTPEILHAYAARLSRAGPTLSVRRCRCSARPAAPGRRRRRAASRSPAVR